MKNKKKTLLMSVAAVLLVAAGVFGTLAFLSGTTNEVTNTFTAGNVSFEDGNGALDEAKVNEYGEPLNKNGEKVEELANAERVVENKYTLIPGQNYTKDPTVHIKEGSEPAFVYVRVTNPIVDIEAGKTIEEQIKVNNWTKVKGYTDLYKYNVVVNAKTEPKPLVVFNNFKLKEDANVSKYTGAEIKIKAFAIQSTNLGDTDSDKAAGDKLGATKTP